jgi:hypothetical protein
MDRIFAKKEWHKHGIPDFDTGEATGVWNQ